MVSNSYLLSRIESLEAKVAELEDDKTLCKRINSWRWIANVETGKATYYSRDGKTELMTIDLKTGEIEPE